MDWSQINDKQLLAELDRRLDEGLRYRMPEELNDLAWRIQTDEQDDKIGDKL